MHPNPAFRQEKNARSLELVRQRSFGTLAINDDEGPLLSHIPFRLTLDSTGVEFHLVRSNPMVRKLKEPQPAVLSVLGGDAYISPDWYGIPDQVPTWNYVAVHLRGTVSLEPHGTMHGVLEGLSQSMEERLLPKTPWKSEKMDQEIYGRMLRQIVPLRMEVTRIDSTWKLNQNKPDPVRLRAADGVEKAGLGVETDRIVAMMRQVGNSKS